MSLFKKIKTDLFSGEVEKVLLGDASKGVLFKLCGLGLAYLFAFIVARYLGAEAWGQFSLALSIILLASIIGSFGLDTAVLKLISNQNNAEIITRLYQQVLFISLVFSLMATLLVYFFSGWISNNLFHNPELYSLFQLSSFAVIPLTLIKLNGSILQGVGETKKFFFVKFVSQHLMGVLFLLLLLLFFEVDKVVLTAFILGLYAIVLITFYWMIFSEDLIEFKWDLIPVKSYKSVFKLSFPLLLAGSMIFFNKWVDTIMVGMFMEDQDVGVYNIAVKLSGLLAIVLTAVNAISAPEFAKTYAMGNFSKFQEYVQASTKLIFTFTVPLFLILIIFPEFILGLFGNEFRTGWLVLIILSVANLVNALAGSVGYILQMTGSQNVFMYITAASSFTGIVLNLILIPLFGIEGAAIATCITLILWNMACVIYIKYKYNIRTYFKPF